MKLKKNINIITYKTKKECSQKAFEILSDFVNANTLLLLSGGSSPDILYSLIANDAKRKVLPKTAALVDERYGEPFHENSNEKLIIDSGIKKYFEQSNTKFFSVLDGKSLEETAVRYEQKIRYLYKNCPKKIAVMGIGEDGHTAGIAPSLNYDHSRYVIAYKNNYMKFGPRITLTFEALSEIDIFVILVFGQSKQEVLERMFKETDYHLFPASFYTQISSKVFLITDLPLLSKIEN